MVTEDNVLPSANPAATPSALLRETPQALCHQSLPLIVGRIVAINIHCFWRVIERNTRHRNVSFWQQQLLTTKLRPLRALRERTSLQRLGPAAYLTHSMMSTWTISFL